MTDRTRQMMRALAQGMRPLQVAIQFEVTTALVYVLPVRYPDLWKQILKEESDSAQRAS